ncbi:unnamed protein product [Cutaneotrichosporon oleaginosum]
MPSQHFNPPSAARPLPVPHLSAPCASSLPRPDSHGDDPSATPWRSLELKDRQAITQPRKSHTAKWAAGATIPQEWPTMEQEDVRGVQRALTSSSSARHPRQQGRPSLVVARAVFFRGEECVTTLNAASKRPGRAATAQVAPQWNKHLLGNLRP